MASSGAKRLDGKVALVTGGSRGIGRAVAATYVRAGARVYICGRNKEDLDTALRELQASGGEVEGETADVGSVEDVKRVVRSASRRFGTIDVLVNNAGINPAPVKVADMTLGFWRKVFNVNLEGPLRMSQCVAPVMRDHGGGSIVHIGTLGAYYAGSDTVAYGASKAALRNLTVTMAVDWAPWKVRVNLLSPGPFMTEMVRGADRATPGFVEMLASTNAMKRIADPDEIVGPVLYLASDASSYVTGDDITVSGGMRK
jgi:NAD(P)-dependent dehydrogenase (short-subunit alcohol dehydrogenase family)